MKFKMRMVGEPLITKQFEHLAGKGSRAAARSGLSKGLTIISRGIRNAVPPKLKSVKKAIGSRINKAEKDAKHNFGAKAGLGVGKPSKSKAGRDPKKPGVGISKNNVHWWELGTKHRFTQNAEYTGKMPMGPPVVQRGFYAARSSARKAMMEQIKKRIQIEAKRKRARQKARAARK